MKKLALYLTCILIFCGCSSYKEEQVFGYFESEITCQNNYIIISNDNTVGETLWIQKLLGSDDLMDRESQKLRATVMSLTGIDIFQKTVKEKHDIIYNALNLMANEYGGEMNSTAIHIVSQQFSISESLVRMILSGKKDMIQEYKFTLKCDDKPMIKFLNNARINRIFVRLICDSNGTKNKLKKAAYVSIY